MQLIRTKQSAEHRQYTPRNKNLADFQRVPLSRFSDHSHNHRLTTMLKPSLILFAGAGTAFGQRFVIDHTCAQLAHLGSALGAAQDGLDWCYSKESISVGTVTSTYTTTVTDIGVETSTSTAVITQYTTTTANTTVFSGTVTSTAANSTITSTASTYVYAQIFALENTTADKLQNHNFIPMWCCEATD